MAMEQSARAANAFFVTMRGQPIVLAMVVVVGVLLTYIFYVQYRQLQTRDNNLAQLFEAQKVIFNVWGNVLEKQNDSMQAFVKQQVILIDKLSHCLEPDEVIKLLQQRSPPPPPP